MNNFQLEGFDDLIKELEDLGRKGNRIENKALRLAAEPILKEAKLRAPKRTGKGAQGLTIGKPRKRENRKEILIGINKSDMSEIYYMKFHEFGTSKMSARPFLGPAYEMKKQEALRIMKCTIKGELGL